MIKSFLQKHESSDIKKAPKMKTITTQPTDKLSGTIAITPSKSHSLRAILFASFAEGDSIIHNYLESPDAFAMIKACRMLGATIEEKNRSLYITGVNGKPKTPDDVIDSGNSGQVLRFVGALAGLCTGHTVITGDESVRSRRPVAPLLDGLQQLGATAVSTRGNDCAPIIIKGPLTPGEVTIESPDSQPVSGLLMVAAFLPGTTQLHVINAGEKPWIGLTLDWFDRLGIEYSHEDFEHFTIKGNGHYKGFEYTVPGDFSSAAFPAAAALVTQSEVTLYPIDMNDSQGDKKIFPALERMGAKLDYDADQLTLTVKPSQLTGQVIDINDFIDAITILAVIGCYAEGQTQITGASIARLKECNRIEAICHELKRMGADIEETEDGLIVKQSSLVGIDAPSYHDHRMVMSLSVAGLGAKGKTSVTDTACVSKSFPGFAEAMHSIGALMRETSS